LRRIVQRSNAVQDHVHTRCRADRSKAIASRRSSARSPSFFFRRRHAFRRGSQRIACVPDRRARIDLRGRRKTRVRPNSRRRIARRNSSNMRCFAADPRRRVSAPPVSDAQAQPIYSFQQIRRPSKRHRVGRFRSLRCVSRTRARRSSIQEPQRSAWFASSPRGDFVGSDAARTRRGIDRQAGARRISSGPVSSSVFARIAKSEVAERLYVARLERVRVLLELRLRSYSSTPRSSTSRAFEVATGRPSATPRRMRSLASKLR